MRNFAVAVAGILLACIPAHAAPFLYVPDCTDDFGCSALAVVDTATDTVLQHIELTHPEGEGFPAWAVRVNPAGTRVWVTSSYGNGLAIVDPATQSQIGFVDLGGDGPGGVAVNDAETRAWLPLDGGSIHLVDLVGETPLVEDIYAGGNPAGTVLHPDQSRLYVSTSDGSGIDVVDPDTLAVGSSIPGGPMKGIAIDGCGTRLYAADALANALLVVDATTDTVVTSVPLPAGALFDVAVAPDGGHVYVTDFAGLVHAVDTATFAVTTVNVGPSLWGVSVHPDGSRVYVVRDDPGPGGSVVVLDPLTLATLDTVTGLEQPSGFGGQMIQPGPPSCPEAAAKCHRAKQIGRFSRQTVALADALESKTTNVKSPETLCNAVDDGGPQTRRLCYRVSDVHGQARRLPTDEIVTDPLGTLTLVVSRGQTLCMPVEGDGPPLKCYRAKQKPRTPRFAPRDVAVTDAFGTVTLRVKKPVQLCTEVGVDGAPVADPDARRVCYRAGEARGEPRFPATTLDVADAFGDHSLRVRRPKLLCLPAR
jgi:YVTN family beta-propeller protein